MVICWIDYPDAEGVEVLARCYITRAGWDPAEVEVAGRVTEEQYQGKDGLEYFHEAQRDGYCNGFRRTTEVHKPLVAESGFGAVAGQEIGRFNDLRFDVLARDMAVTSWENRFVATDTLQQQTPPQIALMTLVWVRQPSGWRILHYHDSTRPALDAGTVGDGS
jgi:hypothetical protein